MKRTIPTIGIVGGIGSGKSLVADTLAKHGGCLISADQLGHEALRQPHILAKLVKCWGKDILDTQGEPDRKKIGRIVFADRAELQVLESLVFPYIESHILEEITNGQSKPGVQFIILDAAIMLETGWRRHCDKVIFVDAPRPIRLARLAQRGWNEQELDRREAAQMPLGQKRQLADAVIVNDGDFQKVADQVKVTLEQWNIIC